jgi:hypothetical protein
MNDWILITRLSETSWISVIRNKDGWSSSILAQYVTPMSIGTHRRNSYITPPPVLTALLITRSSKKTRTTRKATVQDVRQDRAQQNYLRMHGTIKWSWELRTCRFMFWHSSCPFRGITSAILIFCTTDLSVNVRNLKFIPIGYKNTNPTQMKTIPVQYNHQPIIIEGNKDCFFWECCATL